MKSSLRAFGIGLFVAGAGMALSEQFATHSEPEKIAAYEQQLKEYEEQVAGLYEQLDNQNTGSVNEKTENTVTENTKVKETNTTSQPVPSNEEKTTEKEVIEATIYIYENVSLYTIGQQAEDLGIVSNGRELELHLAKPEYSRSIQKGAFDLRSDMTIDQIAKVLTGQPID
ncbi:hypothetical protein ACTHOQ_18575 [Solibacillus silvestris]|uniref:hypothetical protein n=1 Tax=Solibacillus silvestris TaxID=76853 RepID=UPI003F820E8F